MAEAGAQAVKRALGEVVKVDHHRGFGFIRTEAGLEYFFHVTAVDTLGGIEALQIGDAVTFHPESTAKGPRALKVRLEEGRGGRRMSFYCGCSAKVVKDGGDAVIQTVLNHTPIEDHEVKVISPEGRASTAPVLALEQRMRVKKVGVEQVLVEVGSKGVTVRKHYPNVDILECPDCGARVVRE